MTNIEHLRAQAAICYGFANSTDDPEIKRKMIALANTYEGTSKNSVFDDLMRI
jgi:hypothetical protein